ncbi:MAG: hypothetical protein QOG64_3073 [Acidimicrobiaceae bacterium]|nr:hypothetical protein [Acidimicrobiaceae bacterium]
MRSDKPIQAYLQSVRSSLHVPKARRRRVLEEIQAHLDVGAAAYMRRGEAHDHAIALAIDELGSPEAVAAEFNEEGSPIPASTGSLRWLPMLPPLVPLVVVVGSLAWSLTWIPGGWTAGEQAVQRTYVRSAVIIGVLSYATYFSIKRAGRDQAWRWAAWLCAGLALLSSMAIGTR